MTNCKQTPNGLNCPTDENIDCSPFELVNDNINCLAALYAEEHLNTGGAIINVFKLLGIHEQGSLIDLAKNGTIISSGSAQGHPNTDVFLNNQCQWHSSDIGQNVLANAFIGYDFGEIKLDNGRARYGIDTSVCHHITTLIIKQHDKAENRATKVRVERSSDGIKWFGVDILNLIDDGLEHTYNINQSTQARFWRIRPIEFNGTLTNSFWGIERIELMDYSATRIDNIQDEDGFLENRDRDYATQSIIIKAEYDVQDIILELTRFNLNTPNLQFYLTVSFNAVVNRLGRPFVIGDIIEIPSEAQFTPTLKRIKKFLEVTDVAWSNEGYTPGWVPTLQRIIAAPLYASQETMDVVGDIDLKNEDGTYDISSDIFEDLRNVNDKIVTSAKKNVPEHGCDDTEIREFTEEEICSLSNEQQKLVQKLNHPPTLYSEDGLPKNGEPFTEGDEFPTSQPKDKDYHRLTYNNIDEDIAPRLYRYSAIKNRWILMEVDRRFKYNPRNPTLSKDLKELDNSSTPKQQSQSAAKIGK